MERRSYVYILTNKTRTIVYVGVTNDLFYRLHHHQIHSDPKSFTARYDVTTLVYFEEFSHIEEAILREKQIKSWNRKRKNRLVESMNPTWEDLTLHYLN